MILNRATLQALFTGLSTAFNNGLNNLGMPATVYSQYAMTVPSSTAQQQYAWLGMLPGLREWIGDRQINNLATSDFTIRNRKFESTIAVLKEHIEDDQLGLYTPMATMLGTEAIRHRQELIDALVLGGFTNLCYDGQPFFHTSHPVTNADGTVTTVSNTQGGGGNAWFLIDASRPVKPFILQMRKEPQFVAMDKLDDERVFTASEFRFGVDWRGNVGYGLWQLAYASRQTLDEANYSAARAAMRGMSGERGRKLGISPNILLVGPSNEIAALKLVEAEYNASGATNVLAGTTKVVVSSYLQ